MATTTEQAQALKVFQEAAMRYRVVVRGAGAEGSRTVTDLMAQYRIEYINAFVAAVGCGAINGGASGLHEMLWSVER